MINEVFTDDNEDNGQSNDRVDNSIGSEEIIEKEFTTLKDAYEFYNKYALLCGFGTLIHNSHKTRRTKKIFWKEYVCNKQRFKNLNDKRVVEITTKDVWTWERDVKQWWGLPKQIGEIGLWIIL